MAGTRFDCKEHSLFDGSGTAAGGADGGPGVRGRRVVSVAPPRNSRRVARRLGLNRHGFGTDAPRLYLTARSE